MADLMLQLDPATIGTSQHHDLVLGPSGDLVLTDGVEAIRQAVVQALKMFFQDWFLDTSVGLPYYQQLFGVRSSQGLTSAFEASMQSTILRVPGVIGLLTWGTTYDRSARQLAVKFTAQVTGGVVSWATTIGLQP